MLNRRFTVAALLFVATTPARLHSQSGEATKLSADTAATRTITFPQLVDGFRLVSRRDYPEPRDGLSLRYRRQADSLSIDVFLYPGPDFADDCPNECAAEVLRKEHSGFETVALQQMQTLKYVDTAFVRASFALNPAAGATWKLGHWTLLAVVRGGVMHRSHQVLYYLPGTRVKLRATYPETADYSADIREFGDHIIAELMAPAANAKR
jgi:hypothetical protein